MFRTMRRKGELLPQDELESLLKSCKTGILALHGDDGYPYTVPVNYVYQNGKLYFHSAREGHKIDSILRNEKVSFCVIGKDKVIPAAFATQYRSVVVFGRARILEDSEKRPPLEWLIEKYSPGFIEEGRAEIETGWSGVCVVEITVESMSGKSNSVG